MTKILFDPLRLGFCQSKAAALIVGVALFLIGCEKPEVTNSSGASTLPDCKIGDEVKWTDCVGAIKYTNGDTYAGEFKSGKYFGFGIYEMKSGDKYEGGFKDNLKHGQGTYTFSTGEKYSGGWAEGKRQGEAVYSYADGRRFVGKYENDKRIDGKEYNPDGEVLREWTLGVVSVVQNNRPAKNLIPEFDLSCATGGGGAWYRIASKGGEIYFSSIVNEANIRGAKKSYEVDSRGDEISVKMKSAEDETVYYLLINRKTLYSTIRHFASKSLYPPDGFSVMGMTCESIKDNNLFTLLKSGYESRLSEAERKKQEYQSRPNKI